MSVRISTRLAPVLVALGCLAPQVALADPAYRDPTGTFLTEDGRARIRVEKCMTGSESMCGYVVWMKPNPQEEGPKLDVKNPDGRRRTRTVLGHQLMLGLAANEEGQYVGKIYNNEDGKKYDVTIWLERPAVLKVKGCLIAFLCSTQTWNRTADVISGQLTGATGSATGPRPDPEYASGAPATPKREVKPKT